MKFLWKGPRKYKEELITFWWWSVYSQIIWAKTRSTQRAQTSLAEADHYSHIAHCKNVEPWLWKTTHHPKKKRKKRFWIITSTTIWVCYHYYGVFLLIYSSYNTQITTKIQSVLPCTTQDPSILKFHPNPLITFWVMLSTDKQTDRQTNRQADRQTDKQTNQRYQKHNLLCQGGKNTIITVA